MKLAFNGQAHYTDFSEGYELYKKRSRKEFVGKQTYNRIIRKYCKILADRLLKYGMVDLPCNMGAIVATRITRTAQFRGDKFIGFGKIDWANGRYDGQLKTFGLTYLPRHGKNNNLRGFGFVANRQLFKRVKAYYEGDECSWRLIDFKDEMI